MEEQTMKQVQPDLWETEVENPMPGLTTHAYLLTRQDGNVLFYNTGHRHEIDNMAELGGVAYQYLSHRDELGDTLRLIGERFGTRLGGHAKERAAFARIREPDILFRERETHLDNIEIIPTPGHSPGSTCFLVQSPHGKKYLFTGDTIYLGARGEWRAGFIPGYSKEEDRVELAESLRLLRNLDPDIVFSSAFAGDTGFQEMSPGDWPARVDLALKRLLA
jgi:hydroxyacylglutathione hydrolase